MRIKHKLYTNLILFVLFAIYLGYREMYMMYPDAVSFLNLTM